MKEYNTQNLYVLGDTHSLDCIDLLKHYDLNDFILIHVGDAGEGFHHINRDAAELNRLEQYCEEHRGQIFIVRGNHSDPAFFNPEHIFNSTLKHIEFVPDYSYKNINGKVFLFVGGATSIDRQNRIVDRDYWTDEVFVLKPDYKNLDPCDILITHSSGSNEFPIDDGFSRISGWFKNDRFLKDELIAERQDIQKLYDHVSPRVHCWGHFHEVSSEYVEGTWQRCLDINEVINLTNYLK